MSSHTRVQLPIPSDLEKELRRVQAGIPAEIVYHEFPLENTLFDCQGFDDRERFGLCKNLSCTIVESLPKKVGFCDITKALSIIDRVRFSVGEVSYSRLPYKPYDELVVVLSSKDLMAVHQKFVSEFGLCNELGEWFLPRIRLGYIKKDAPLQGVPELEGFSEEITTKMVQIVYPTEVVDYFLDGKTPWLIDQPIVKTPELLITGVRGEEF